MLVELAQELDGSVRTLWYVPLVSNTCLGLRSRHFRLPVAFEVGEVVAHEATLC